MTSKPRLPKRYDSKEIEPKWQKFWEEQKIYRFDPDSDRPIYSIDTPPPTVSGNLHIGHVFSYTHTEIQARFFRMRGYNVYYPMGWDDNGLPTERLTEKELGIVATDLPREEFIAKCFQVTEKYERNMEDLWRRLGLSIDWTLTYSTISEKTRRISQRSFLDLYRKGRIYRSREPMIWCPECLTAIAQAEIESKPLESTFNDLVFRLESGEELIIATTRPELLPACVAIFVHPEDKRYQKLIGQKATVPLFGQTVEIFADEHVDPEKGTGVVMCCTFGDRQDVEWWKTRQLPLKLAITEDGKMNELAGEFAGLSIPEARVQILEKLRAEGLLKTQKPIVHDVQTHERCGTPIEFVTRAQWMIRVLDKKEELIAQADKIQWYPAFMKNRYVNWVAGLAWDWCISRQRFFGVPFPVWHCQDCGGVVLAREEDLPVDPLRDKPSSACECGSQNLEGDPDVMDTWATSSLTPEINWRWGEEDEDRRLQPMSLRPQAHEIIRTWAFYTITKSYYHHQNIPWKNIVISGFVTPPRELFDIPSQFVGDLNQGRLSGALRKAFEKQGYPLDESAQVDVLTKGEKWFVYAETDQLSQYFLIRRGTKKKLYVCDGEEEARRRAGGHAKFIRRRGKAKISKSKHGDKYSPLGLLERYSADTLRLWASSAPLGCDLPLNLDDFEQNKRFLTKIWNAYRFCDIHLQGEKPTPPNQWEPIDLYMLAKLNETIQNVTEYFESYDYRTARLQIDQFFKGTFCDDYIEIVKDRLYNREKYSEEAYQSARYTLYTVAYHVLRLYAPFIPHICEELYQLLFREKEEHLSVHTSGWPEPLPIEAEGLEQAKRAGRIFLEVLHYVRRTKGNRKMSLKDLLPQLTISAPDKTHSLVEPLLSSLCATAGVEEIQLSSHSQEELRLAIEGEEEVVLPLEEL